MIYTAETWIQFEGPQHFCGAGDCKFHLGTKVGPWIVSTVGEYIPPGCSSAREIGWKRTYETMVFRAVKCTCGKCEGYDIDPAELDMLPANDAVTATANHSKLCAKWANEEDNQ